jgi:hypothetical protein
MDNSSFIFEIDPPTEAIFSSREELNNYLCSWSMQQGYVLSIGRSKKDLNFNLICDRGGHDRNILGLTKDSRKRLKGSKKIECKFSIKGVKRKDGWTFWVQNRNHNHPPEENLRGHPMARRMNATQSKLIITALNTGSTPRAAAALLRATDPTFTASSQDIKNLKNKTNRSLVFGK